MSFPPGAQAKRTNFAKMSAGERDRIIAALRATPGDIEGIAARFNRGVSTVEKLRGLAGLSRAAHASIGACISGHEADIAAEAKARGEQAPGWLGV